MEATADPDGRLSIRAKVISLLRDPTLRFLTFASVIALLGAAPLAILFWLRIPSNPWNSYTPAAAPFFEVEVFNIKRNSYEARLSMLDTNLKLQGLVAIVAVAVMASRKRAPEAPMFNIGVPALALYLLIPLLAMFLWLQFGYLLSDLIDLRICLYEGAGVGVPASMPRESLHSRVLTLRNALNDGGFLDAWFRQYLPDFVDGRGYLLFSKIGNVVAMTIVYGGLLGGAHAAMIYMLFRGGQRAESEAVKRVCRCALFGAAALLLWTHWQFYFAESNQSWQHLSIAAGFIGSLLLIAYILKAIDDQGPQREPRVPEWRIDTPPESK